MEMAGTPIFNMYGDESFFGDVAGEDTCSKNAVVRLTFLRVLLLLVNY